MNTLPLRKQTKFHHRCHTSSTCSGTPSTTAEREYEPKATGSSRTSSPCSASSSHGASRPSGSTVASSSWTHTTCVSLRFGSRMFPHHPELRQPQHWGNGDEAIQQKQSRRLNVNLTEKPTTWLFFLQGYTIVLVVSIGNGSSPCQSTTEQLETYSRTTDKFPLRTRGHMP